MTEHDSEGSIPAARLDALTDGVVAIAITLLVLDLRLPEEIGHLGGIAVGGLLLDMHKQFASYAVSFLVVGSLWLNHVQVLRGRGPVDATIVWLTFGFLAAVAMLPFTTALLSRSHGAVATAIYAGSMGIASLLLGLMGMHRAGWVWQGAVIERFSVPLLFAATIGIAFWNPMVARLAWLLIIPLSLFGTKRRPPRDSA